MKLYDFPLSGNCYKVRLQLSLIGQKAELETVDLLAGQNRKADFLQLNPMGQVPALLDQGVTLRDSQAILLYLARSYAPGWAPDDAATLGEIFGWLSLAASEIANGPAALRLIKKFGADRDEATAHTLSETVFALFEQYLGSHRWLVGEQPSIADVACYPYLALSPEGGWSLDPYPAVRAWFARIEALPGYVGMPGIFASSQGVLS